MAMQPRGQLWFELEKVCKDFREFSGVGAKEGLEILVVVLTNMEGVPADDLARQILTIVVGAPGNKPRP